MKRPVLAITMGDPGGIGPEIIAKTFKRFSGSNAFIYLVIGSRSPFEALQKRSGWQFSFKEVEKKDLGSLSSEKINFLSIDEPVKIKMKARVFGFDQGKVSFRNAVLAHETLKAAAQLAVSGKVQAIVTAPINKTAMRLIDRNFHGHTEFLAYAAGVKAFAMMFVSPQLKVTLVTIHEPISKVSRLITRSAVLEKIRLTDSFLKKRWGLRSPKIGVCALNPHGRETGTEDEIRIRPAVEKAKRMGIKAVGPVSADQLFHEAYEGRVDGVISMYHDQGLAPFKMIAFRDGVNVTLGLPFVRTSPDHGTAFDIAYQNKADETSFISALKLAEKLVK